MFYVHSEKWMWFVDMTEWMSRSVEKTFNQVSYVLCVHLMTHSEISNEQTNTDIRKSLFTCADGLTHAHLHTREQYFVDFTDGKRYVTMEAWL